MEIWKFVKNILYCGLFHLDQELYFYWMKKLFCAFQRELKEFGRLWELTKLYYEQELNFFCYIMKNGKPGDGLRDIYIRGKISVLVLILTKSKLLNFSEGIRFFIAHTCPRCFTRYLNYFLIKSFSFLYFM